MSSRLSIGQCATLACVWEATIPKPGNVHRAADFEDATFTDFVTSAVVIGPAMADARRYPVGETVLSAVQATRQWVGTNTNLGTILLIAPLAAVPLDTTLLSGVGDILKNLDANDAQCVYEAIRIASPGGMGQVDEMDVAGEVPDDLLAAMRAVADRDLVARQYTNDYAQLFDFVTPRLRENLQKGLNLEDATVHVHVRMMAEFPDSLIARKCGKETAAESARRAKLALSAGEPGQAAYQQAVADLDFWLRSDGHRRNPGTTADMIAAGLFALLREGGLDVSSQ